MIAVDVKGRFNNCGRHFCCLICACLDVEPISGVTVLTNADIFQAETSNRVKAALAPLAQADVVLRWVVLYLYLYKCINIAVNTLEHGWKLCGHENYKLICN